MRIKVNMKYLGFIVHHLTSILQKTLRIKIHAHKHYQPTQPYLFAFWHGKQLLPVLELVHHQTKRAALVSSSRDGEMLATWLEKLNYEVVRGSSRKNNVSALTGMMRKLKAGYSMGFGIDGPIGPIYKVKPGMTHMAQRCGIAIIPVGSAFSRKWIMQKAWDKFEIPKPFARAVFYVGEPLFIQADGNLEAFNLLLETRIHEAEQKAESLL